MSPVPTIILGKQSAVALNVKKGLEPEYEGKHFSLNNYVKLYKTSHQYPSAIHIILLEERALSELPLLLSKPPKQPPDSNDNLGTQNYDVSKVSVVVVGGGYCKSPTVEVATEARY